MFYLEMDDGIATDGEVNAVVDEVMARTEGTALRGDSQHVGRTRL